jgi:molecular chaperone GrpE
MCELHRSVANEKDVPVTVDGEPTDSATEQALDLLRRERANFLNYKRRVERERAEDRERARLELLEELLPVLDDLDRALTHMPPRLATDQWAQGVALGHRRFVEALRGVGLEHVGVDGENFDPAVHEAVAYEEQPDARQQRVLRVLRPGYRAGRRLLRPAQVVVVGPPPQIEPARRNGRTRGSGPAEAAA